MRLLIPTIAVCLFMTIHGPAWALAHGSADVAPDLPEAPGLELAGTCAVPLDAEWVASRVPHDPIVIDDEGDFTAANGVVGGTGTPEDPYIISGWLIEAQDNDGVAIYDVSARVVIEDNLFVGAPRVGATGPGAVRIDGVDGAVVRDNAMMSTTSGVLLFGSEGALVEGNTIYDNGWAGVEMWGGGFHTVRGNTIVGTQEGIFIGRTEDPFLAEYNTLFLNRDGIVTMGANGSVIRYNSITVSQAIGFHAIGDATIDARHNWWGADDGPSGDGHGSGDEVRADAGAILLVDPWLVEDQDAGAPCA